MSTSAQSGTKHTLEIAHVLFLDIVVYSRMAMEEQELVLRRLQEAVRATDEVTRAQDADELISLPTGDGMALVFFNDAEAPVRCALELNRSLKTEPAIQVRMGIHSGPVYRVADINASPRFTGKNMAVRKLGD